MPDGDQPLNTRAFRRTIGFFATGVTVVAAGDAGEWRAMTANAITSLSLEPMLLILCVHKKAHMAAWLQEGRGFSVNILRQEQRDLSTYFAGGWAAGEDPPPFEFVPWKGGPRLAYCAAAIGCEQHQMLDGGDHWIVVGKVIALYRGRDPIDPLLFYRGRYRTLAREPDYAIPAVWDFAW